jgi:uncharacterized protein
MAEWRVEEVGGGVRFRVRVVPRARRSEVAGLWSDCLKIRLAAPPVEGAANRALVAFVAARLGVRQAQVELIGGETSREKTLRVQGVTVQQVRERLHP